MIVRLQTSIALYIERDMGVLIYSACSLLSCALPHGFSLILQRYCLQILFSAYC